MGRINRAILMVACFGAGLGISWLTHRSDAAPREPERSEDRAHVDRGLEFEKLWREASEKRHSMDDPRGNDSLWTKDIGPPGQYF